MKFILILALVMSTDAVAQVQHRTFEDPEGRTTGRSVTDSKGRTTFYDNMGRNTGRSVTDARGNTTVYDNMGRQMEHVRRR